MWLLADIMRRYAVHYAWNADRLGDPPATAHYCAWMSVNVEIDRGTPGLPKPERGHAALGRTPWPLDG